MIKEGDMVYHKFDPLVLQGRVRSIIDGEVLVDWADGATDTSPLVNILPWYSRDKTVEETRVVDDSTGGMKGSKLAKFSSIPKDVLWELAEHYGRGQAKYPDDPDGTPNWQRGYNWRLNVDALHRHLALFEQGEDFDKETGSSHLIAVIWHAITLRWFQLHDKGKDYRA